MPVATLLDRIWQLSANVTGYDAPTWRSLTTSAPVITCGAKLAAAGGARCAFDLIA